MPTYHSKARTDIHARQQIQNNPDGLTQRGLAQRYRISVATVNKWRRRHSLCDASCRPVRHSTAFTKEQEQLLLSLRTQGQLSLDDLLDQVEPIVPNATRSSLYRLLKRHGLQQLPRAKKPPHGAFDEAIVPGFLHIDSFILTCLPGQSNQQSQRQHCFVAIDRATRMVFLQVYDTGNSEAACDFLERCRSYFPFALHTVLTDNGGQYTLKANARAQHTAGRKRPFELLCAHYGIQHKTTRPYTPKTNGLVERVHGLIQAATTKRVRYQDQAQRDQALGTWLLHYTFTKKHRRIPLGVMTPFEAACRWYATKPELFTKRPERNTLLSKICSQPPET
jgi:transposase/transposase-like protein